MRTARFVLSMTFVGILALDAGVASGQDYPIKPIRIVTSAAGGNGDFLSRSIADGISGRLGQKILVENRANDMIQGEAVYRAPPDGYTLLLAGGTFWTFPLLQKTSYDPLKDFAPITMTEVSPLVLVVHPSLPVRSVKELIALIKARPGELNYSTPGVGSSFHLATEIFNATAGVRTTHVSYKGTAPSIIALLAGEVQLQFGPPSSLRELVKSGRLRALAVTSAQPSALFPGLPALAASGLPGYEAAGLTGVFAPARTPAAIIDRLNQEIVRYLNRPDVKQTFIDRGAEVIGSTPAQLGAAVEADMRRSGKMIKALGLRLD